MTPATREFHHLAGASAKFWSITIDGPGLRVSSGPIGTGGRSVVTPFDNEDMARLEADRQIQKRLAKGYVEVDIDSLAEQLLAATFDPEERRYRTWITCPVLAKEGLKQLTNDVRYDGDEFLPRAVRRRLEAGVVPLVCPRLDPHQAPQFARLLMRWLRDPVALWQHAVSGVKEDHRRDGGRLAGGGTYSDHLRFTKLSMGLLNGAPRLGVSAADEIFMGGEFITILSADRAVKTGSWDVADELTRTRESHRGADGEADVSAKAGTAPIKLRSDAELECFTSVALPVLEGLSRGKSIKVAFMDCERQPFPGQLVAFHNLNRLVEEAIPAIEREMSLFLSREDGRITPCSLRDRKLGVRFGCIYIHPTDAPGHPTPIGLAGYWHGDEEHGLGALVTGDAVQVDGASIAYQCHSNRYADFRRSDLVQMIASAKEDVIQGRVMLRWAESLPPREQGKKQQTQRTYRRSVAESEDRIKQLFEALESTDWPMIFYISNLSGTGNDSRGITGTITVDGAVVNERDIDGETFAKSGQISMETIGAGRGLDFLFLLGCRIPVCSRRLVDLLRLGDSCELKEVQVGNQTMWAACRIPVVDCVDFEESKLRRKLAGGDLSPISLVPRGDVALPPLFQISGVVRDMVFTNLAMFKACINDEITGASLGLFHQEHRQVWRSLYLDP